MKITKTELKELIRETKEEYQEFFKKVLKKFDVESPDELDDNKKKEFFNYINQNWNSGDEKGKDGEVNESIIKESNVKFDFGKMMKFIDKDGFLEYVFKTMKGTDKVKANALFNTHILGISNMEREYKKIK